jgi:L-iditol 2-dehydrogenase
VSRVSPGDRVAIEPAISCGACDQCLAGRANTCRHIIFMSTSGQSDGLLCEQVTVPEANCIPIPDGMALETVALAEPLSISVYSVQKSVPITPETRIGILGAGPIGLGILAVCKAYGAERTYITDRLDYRIDAARGLGATWGGNPDQGDIVSAIEELEPLQMDVVFECCGKQEAIDQAIQLLKPGGKLMLVGIPEESQISIGIDTARRHEITIYNVRRQCGCVEEAIELLDNGSIDPKAFITHRLPLECAPEAFRMVDNYANGVIKAIVTTQGERI